MQEPGTRRQGLEQDVYMIEIKGLGLTFLILLGVVYNSLC